VVSPRWWAAIDLGASSARVVAARWRVEEKKLEDREIGRTPNRPLLLPDGLHWDVTGLYGGALQQLVAEAATAGPPDTVAVDGWGVDYGLLDDRGRLLGVPFHYRDRRTVGRVAEVEALVDRATLYRMTGIQTMPINTIYQLMAEKESAAYRVASQLLLLPDLITYLLCGETGSERTNASTTQLLGPDGRWSTELFRRIGVRPELFAPVVEPGTPRASLRPDLVDDLGLSGGPLVVSVASHDTASAVAAVPADESVFGYVVSGTWSLVGLELSAPVLTDRAAAANFTNEHGIDGTYRFLRNVMGFWLLQECERAWGHPVRPSDARTAVDVWDHVFDPDRPELLPRGRDMPQRIEEAARAMSGRAPGTEQEMAVAITASLSLAYADVLEQAEAMAGRRAAVVHIVGGASQNELLCQLTADTLGRPVVAGPVEASALGNLLLQRRARGEVGDLEELRSVVRRSVELRHFSPTKPTQASEVLERWRSRRQAM